MRTLFKPLSLFTLIIAMSFIPTLASAACRVVGSYTAQDDKGVSQFSILPDHTFTKSVVNMSGASVLIELKETGTWSFLPGCAIKLTSERENDDHDSFSREKSLAVKFTNFKRIGKTMFPNVGLFKGGSMVKTIQ